MAATLTSVLDTLHRHQAELRNLGVDHAAVSDLSPEAIPTRKVT